MRTQASANTATHVRPSGRRECRNIRDDDEAEKLIFGPWQCRLVEERGNVLEMLPRPPVARGVSEEPVEGRSRERAVGLRAEAPHAAAVAPPVTAAAAAAAAAPVAADIESEAASQAASQAAGQEFSQGATQRQKRCPGQR